MAVTRFFNPAQQANMADNRGAVVNALVNAGMSEADADNMVTEWTTAYDQLKADLAMAKNAAETKAREAADKAAHALALFLLCYFVAFVLGAFAATCGGKQGAKCANKCDACVDTIAA